MESGLPFSMIRVTYFDDKVSDEQITEAFQKNIVLPFRSETLKTIVIVRGFADDKKEEKHEYILQERAAEVSSGYKSIIYVDKANDKKMSFIVPEDLQWSADQYELSLLPYKRLILRKDIPENWLSSGRRSL